MKPLVFGTQKVMSMIKQAFRARYSSCVIAPPSEYKLGSIGRPVVFDVDCAFSMPPASLGDRCDEFVFFDINRNITGVYLIEQKTNQGDNLAKVQAQLQGGAWFIEIFLHNDPALDQYGLGFIPVLVSKGIRPASRNQLRTLKISLRGMREPIQHVDRKKILPRLAA